MIPLLNYIHTHILYLNSSKFFAGCMMILLNIGSKFLPITFSKSAEEYLKLNISKQILIFAMAWMATRDIYTSLVLTAVFVILSDNLFNEESNYCIVPPSYRILGTMIDTNDDGSITPEEIKKAEDLLQKVKQQNIKTTQKENFMKFHDYLYRF